MILTIMDKDYALSSEGLVKAIVVVFGCLTFVPLIDSEIYANDFLVAYVLMHFIMLSTVSAVLGLSRLFGTLSNYAFTLDGLDIAWSCSSSIWCFSRAIIFSSNFPAELELIPTKVKVSIIFAFLTAVAYVFEAYILWTNGNWGFFKSDLCLIKVFIYTFGEIAIDMLITTGITCIVNSSPGCFAPSSYILISFLIAISVTVAIVYVHSIDTDQRTMEISSVIIGVLLFWFGALCFSAYTLCNGQHPEFNPWCKQHLWGFVIGFITGSLFVLKVYILGKCLEE